MEASLPSIPGTYDPQVGTDVVSLISSRMELKMVEEVTSNIEFVFPTPPGHA
jgi:hypothetical protein